MSQGLIFQQDDTIARWAFETYKMPTMKFDKAIGIIDADTHQIIGAIMFQCWNGWNVELSYYGLRRTLTLGIVKTLAKYILFTFNASRVTVSTSRKNKSLLRSLQKLGFKLEGAQHRFYGHRDCNRNTAIRSVMFRERLEQLAQMPANKERKSC